MVLRKILRPLLCLNSPSSSNVGNTAATNAASPRITARAQPDSGLPSYEDATNGAAYSSQPQSLPDTTDLGLAEAVQPKHHKQCEQRPVQSARRVFNGNVTTSGGSLTIATTSSSPEEAETFHAVQGSLQRSRQQPLERDTVDMDPKDPCGCTALLMALKTGNACVAEHLLQRDDCGVNVRDPSGCTALLVALKTGNARVAERLLEREDLDLNVKDNFGNTAF